MTSALIALEVGLFVFVIDGFKDAFDVEELVMVSDMFDFTSLTTFDDVVELTADVLDEITLLNVEILEDIVFTDVFLQELRLVNNVEQNKSNIAKVNMFLMFIVGLLHKLNKFCLV